MTNIVTYEQVHEWMAQANLVTQMVLVSLIILGIMLQRKKRFVWHGNTMLVVVIVNGLLLISHMGPSFISALGEAITTPNIIAFIAIVHGIIGAAAEFLGIWLVAMWAYVSQETGYCAKRTKLMRKILTLWSITLVLGLLYYPLHLIFG